MIPAGSHEVRSYSITISIAQVQIYSQRHNFGTSKHTLSGRNLTAATPLCPRAVILII